ncbi:MAG: hypothetical protein HWE26_12415 [Alteromonadaceae bacterium]|nr:hypothetical protein [Alteromonadaceae bacterium]
MSLMGGAGMFAVSLWNPVIGGWIDTVTEQATAAGMTGDELALASGQAALGNLILFPAVLIIALAGFYVYIKKINQLKRQPLSNEN